MHKELIVQERQIFLSFSFFYEGKTCDEKWNDFLKNIMLKLHSIGYSKTP